MKLLSGQVNEIKSDDRKIVITMGVLQTIHQAELSQRSTIAGITGRMSQLNYALLNCVESVEIDGVKYDPIELSRKADISDKDTLRTMLKIGDMIAVEAFPSVEDEKK